MSLLTKKIKVSTEINYSEFVINLKIYFIRITFPHFVERVNKR